MNNLNQLKQQIVFIVEVDKLKNVLRQTSPIGESRRENSAEHSWQAILCAITFVEHANEPVDLLKVVKMLALHDIVEVDVGDVFHYSKADAKNLFEREFAAAKRIFGLLPQALQEEYMALWLEFEKRETPESRYASAIDRQIPLILNLNNAGGTWLEHNISKAQVLEKTQHIAEGSMRLWDLTKSMIHEAYESYEKVPK